MNNLTKVLTLLPFIFFLLMLASCGNDDDFSPEPTGIVNSEIFNLKGLSINSFVLVSNQDGDILWDTMGMFIDFDVDLKVAPTDKIDVTYGRETSNYFDVDTYRDVQSGFTVNLSPYGCENDFDLFEEDPLFSINNPNDVKLTIEGVSAYDFFQLSFYSPSFDGIIADVINNTLTVSGRIQNTNDLFITVLPQGSSTYKSFTLKYEDWNTAEDLLSRTISFDDFVEPKIHTIDMGQDGLWIPDATFLYANQRPCTIAKWNNSRKTQEGNEIKLFTPADAAIDKLDLQIRSAQLVIGNDLLQVYDEMPTQIDLYDIGINFVNHGYLNYKIDTDGSYDLADIEFHYIINSIGSRWNVYQRSDCALDYYLPLIPSYMLDEMPLLRNRLAYTEDIIAHFYDFDTNEYNELFDKYQIDRKFNCLEYEVKYDFASF